MVSASMGIYVFQPEVLLRALHEDAEDAGVQPRFRPRRAFPKCLGRSRVVAYDFRDMNAKQSRYWRDVGTLDAYYEANMDLVAVTAGIQPLRHALAHPHQDDAAAAGQIRLRAGGPAHGNRGG